MRLRYTRPALADLDAMLDHVAERSPQAAGRIHARIQAIVDLLLTHPRIGVRTEDPAIRRVSTVPYPYLIFYEIAEDETRRATVPATLPAFRALAECGS